jgi:hypothetical protein
MTDNYALNVIGGKPERDVEQEEHASILLFDIWACAYGSVSISCFATYSR